MAKTNYAVVIDGKVVATRQSNRTYTHAVAYACQNNEYFATFHGSQAAAERQRRSSEYYSHPTRLVVPVSVTARLAKVGDLVVPQGVL